MKKYKLTIEINNRAPEIHYTDNLKNFNRYYNLKYKYIDYYTADYKLERTKDGRVIDEYYYDEYGRCIIGYKNME